MKKEVAIEEEIMYNQSIKEDFLLTIENKTTRKIFVSPFKRAMDTEKKFKKDIYDMNIRELGDVFDALIMTTENAAYNQTFRFEAYIDWAIEKGHRKDKKNPLSHIDKLEWSKQFVATYRRSIFTREQILDMCDELVNNADKAVLLSIFEGLGGTGYKEILNLQYNRERKDIIETVDGCFVILHGKDEEIRTIKISNELVEMLKSTSKDSEYVGKNGERSELQVEPHYSEYADSPHIFKKTKRGKQDGELDLFFVMRKFTLYKKVFGLKYLKPKDIERSGMYHMADVMYKQHGELRQEHLTIIADQFNSTWVHAEGSTYRNTTLIKRAIQSDEFAELYGYKIKVKP